MSPDSVLAAADLGARMVMFSQRPWPDQAAAVATYRERFVERHGSEPEPLGDLRLRLLRHRRRPRRGDGAQAHRRLPHQRHAALRAGVSDHFKEAKGYESYGSAVDLLKAIGLESDVRDVPRACRRGARPSRSSSASSARREFIGDYDLTRCFRYAGLPIEDAERSMRTFAAEVLPELRRTEVAA